MIRNFLKIGPLVILLSASSCSLIAEPMPESWNWGIKPRPLTGVKNFPPADTEYGRGFRDGCQSAWDAVSKGLLSDVGAAYDFKRMKKNPDYHLGWNDGFEQCTYIMDWDVV